MSLTNLGECYRRRGHDQKALAALRVALLIIPNTLGTENIVYGACWHNFALLGESYDVSEIVQDSYKRAQDALSGAPPCLPLAIGFAAQAGHAADATERDELSLCALETRRELFGEQHPQFGDGLRIRASMLAAAGDTEQARKLLRQALQIFRVHFDEEHQLVRETLQSLTTLDIVEEGSVPLLQRPLKGAVCAEHPDYEAMLRHQIRTFSQAGRFDEARTLTRELLNIELAGMEVYREDYTLALFNAAQQFLDIGQTRDAEPFIWQLFAIHRRFLGEENVATFESLRLLLLIYRPSLAERLFDIDIEQEVIKLPKWSALAFATRCARVAWDTIITPLSTEIPTERCHQLVCELERSHTETKRSLGLLQFSCLDELETQVQKLERQMKAELNWEQASQWTQSSKALVIVRMALAAMLAPNPTIARKHASESCTRFMLLSPDSRRRSQLILQKLLIWMHEEVDGQHSGIPVVAMERIHWPPPNLVRI